MTIRGRFACQASGAFEQRPEQEVFYSCPSLAAEAFFEAVSNQLAILEGEGSPYAGDLVRQLEQTVEVAQAVQASLFIHSIQETYCCLFLMALRCTILSGAKLLVRWLLHWRLSLSTSPKPSE